MSAVTKDAAKVGGPKVGDGKSAAEVWDDYQADLKKRHAEIAAIDQRLANGSDPSASALVALRQQYVQELDARPPLVLAGMVGDWINEIWAMSYLTLGCLIALWIYPRQKLRIGRILGWTLALYVLSFIQVWTRNHYLNTLALGRTTYVFVNWDMSKSSYVLQEMRQAFMFFLVCMFWEISAQRLAVLSRNLERWKHVEHDGPMQSATTALRVSREALTLWQESTMLMLVVFVPWSFFYWNQIATNKDARYLPAALLLDLIWIVTWFFSCRPLLLAMKFWNEEKLALITHWTGESSSLDAFLKEASNSSDLQVLAASLAAVGSLLIPLIKALS